MSTIRDMIKASMRLVKILGAGEEIAGNDGEDARYSLTMMVDAMTNEYLLIPVDTVISKTLVAAQNEYTIGVYPSPQPDPLPDNHIETAKPVEYKSAYIRDSASTDHRLTIIDESQYNRIGRKSIAARPTMLFIRDGWPMDSLILSSQPYDTETLKIEVKLPLKEYITVADLNEEVNLPPGYENMLVYNLAMRLAPEWGRDIPSFVASEAATSKMNLKAANASSPALVSDAPTGTRDVIGRYDIEGGP